MSLDVNKWVDHPYLKFCEVKCYGEHSPEDKVECLWQRIFCKNHSWMTKKEFLQLFTGTIHNVRYTKLEQGVGRILPSLPFPAFIFSLSPLCHLSVKCLSLYSRGHPSLPAENLVSLVFRTELGFSCTSVA